MTSITLERKALSLSLQRLARTVERRNTIPILSNVRLDLTRGKLTITATDLDIEAKATLVCDSADEAAITVQAHLLNDILRKVPDGAQVNLSWGEAEGRMVVKSGRSRFTLMTLPAEDFPDFDHGELPIRFTVDAATLLGMIQPVGFAISHEETRYYLNGIYLAQSGDELVFVATDGHRLARKKMPLPEGADGLTGVIIPAKTIAQMASLLKDNFNGEATAVVSLSTQKFRIEMGAHVLTSKLIDGTYPDYERVIPKSNSNIARVARAALDEAVDRVATVAVEKSRGLKMLVTEQGINLLMANPETGNATEDVEAKYEGSNIEIGFNSNYLAEILSTLTSQEVNIALSDGSSPAIFTGSEDEELLILLMPMRV